MLAFLITMKTSSTGFIQSTLFDPVPQVSAQSLTSRVLLSIPKNLKPDKSYYDFFNAALGNESERKNVAGLNGFISATDHEIKNLIALNNLEPHERVQMSRFNIQRAVVAAYKYLGKAYELRHEVTGNKNDKQSGFYYETLHEVLDSILFIKKHGRQHLRQPIEIRRKIEAAAQSIENRTKRNNIIQLVRKGSNLLKLSIYVSEQLAKQPKNS